MTSLMPMFMYVYVHVYVYLYVYMCACVCVCVCVYVCVCMCARVCEEHFVVTLKVTDITLFYIKWIWFQILNYERFSKQYYYFTYLDLHNGEYK